MRYLALLSVLPLSLYSQTGAWTQNVNTKINTACPASTGLNNPGGIGGCSAIVDAYSGGAAFDSTRGRVLIWGGGHNDYYGNEIYAFYPSGATLPTATVCSSLVGAHACCTNSTAPAMCRLSNPTIPNNNSAYPTGTTPNPIGFVESIGGSSPTQGEPNAANSRHTYQGAYYDPINDLYVNIGGGLGGASGTNGVEASSGSIWALSLAGLATSIDGANWTQLQTTAGGITGNDPGSVFFSPWAVYVAGNQTVYYGGAQAGGYIWSYKKSTNTVTRLGVGTVSSNNATAVADTSNSNIYFIGGGSVHVLSYGTGTTWTTSLVTTTNCSTLESATFPGAAYDAASNAIYGWPGIGNIIYKFDPGTNTCTALTNTGADGNKTSCSGISATDCPPDHSPSPSGATFGRFVSIGNGRFSLVNSTGNDTYTYQLGGCAITSVSLLSTNTGAPYNQPVNTSGCASPVFSVTVGSLPSQMVIGSSSGSITGFAWASGTSSFTVGVADANCAVNNSGACAANLSITVNNPPLPTTSNTITVSNRTASTTTNYPVQIGRAFVQGEIPSGQVPQAWVGSTAVPTQVDTKNVWGDGSLKFAVLSFMIPTFAASTTYTVTFGIGSQVGNTAITQASMLGAGYNFDAQIQLTNGTTKSASARTMLTASASLPSCIGLNWTAQTNINGCLWNSGPIATTVVLVNHSQGFACVGGVASGAGTTTSAYDFGFSGACGFRPEFIATFWPLTNQVAIRFAGEVDNTENLEDEVVTNLVLTTGQTSPTTVYTLPGGLSPLTMVSLSRWTMSNSGQYYWINGTPPLAAYNHNLAYLESTLLIANYDTSKLIPATQITTAYNAYSAFATADPYDQGGFTKNQSAQGSRTYPTSEIGIYPAMPVMWMYTGDVRAQQMSIRLYELASSFPVHWREGKLNKYIDRSGAIQGMGHWISMSSRPTYCAICGSTYFNYSSIAAGDKITPVGASTAGVSWQFDPAHMPNFSPVYLMTGDYYFLEENWAWASTVALWQQPTNVNFTGRGPTGKEGALLGQGNWDSIQVRGSAWGFAQRIDAAQQSPDNSPEKGYFNLESRDAIAAWEAVHEITASASDSNYVAEWNWAHQFGNAASTAGCVNSGWWCGPNGFTVNPGGTPTSIHWWVAEFQGSSGNEYPLNSSTFETGSALSTEPWQVNVLIYSLGHAKDLGYPTTALLNWIGPTIISMATDPSTNPYFLGAYFFPVVAPNGTWVSTWSQVTSYICASTATGCCIHGQCSAPNDNAQTATTYDVPMSSFTGCAFSQNGDGSCGTPYFAGMALAQLTNLTNGVTAWNWINTTAMSNSALNLNPQLAIVPRSLSQLLVLPSLVYGGVVH